MKAARGEYPIGIVIVTSANSYFRIPHWIDKKNVATSYTQLYPPYSESQPYTIQGKGNYQLAGKK